MKRILFSLLTLLALQGMVMAQGFLAPPFDKDLGLDVNFAAISDVSEAHSPFGSAAYVKSDVISYSFGTNGIYPNIISNLFAVSINLGTNRATDGWIFQAEKDGSFTPIMELTNQVSSPEYLIIQPWSSPPIPVPYLYRYSQDHQLTDDQIQNLLAGNWYAEVDYGDDKYLGNLTPTYIRPPTASATASPVALFFSTNYWLVPHDFTSFYFHIHYFAVIAPNNNATTVALDGSASSDSFYLPLQFLWQDENNFLATTATVTNVWEIGAHQVSLEVSDGYSLIPAFLDSGTANISLEIISPSEAVDRLIFVAEQANLNRKSKLLLSVLSQAESAFNRNNMTLGVRQLEFFQNQVRLQIAPTDSADAASFIEGAQEIIDAVDIQISPHPFHRHH